MSRNLRLVPAIQWYEGMLLSPQHFQQLELRSQQLLTTHMHALSHHHWGVVHLEFDQVTVATGLVTVLQVHAIMPDGLVVDYSQAPNTTPLSLDLTPFTDALEGKEHTLYLCVPELISGSSPITGDWQRYTPTDGDDVTDDNVSDNVIHVPRLQPKISLILSDSPPPRYSSIPIAKLEYIDEVFVFVSYMPPCFEVHGKTPLADRMSKLLRRFREKAGFLSEKWQTQIGTPLLMETSQQLKPIVESIPVLEPIFHTGKAHPAEIHRLLCVVAGKMSTLRLGQVPPVFPTYNHNEIMNSCLPMLDWIHIITDSIEKAFSVLMFSLQDGYFSVKLQPDIITNRIMIGLRTSSTMTEPEMIDWMKDAIIVSESMLEAVRVRRITGAPRKLMDEAETLDLMAGRGVCLFAIKTDNAFIKSDERLYIFNPADTPDKRPMEAVLYLRHAELDSSVVESLKRED